MSAPYVRLTERDFSQVTPPITGVAGAIVFPALRGPVGVPTFIGSKAQFRQIFTRYQKMEAGFDMGHWSAETFLATSSQLWVVRVANASLYGGARIGRSLATNANVAYSTGTGLTVDITAAVGPITAAVPHAGATGTGWRVGDRIAVTSGGGTGGVLEVATVTGSAVATLTIVVAGTGYATTAAATVSNLSAGQSAPATTYATSPGFLSDEAFTLFGADQGTWNNDLGIRIYPYRAAEALATNKFTVDPTNTIQVTQVWSLGEEISFANNPSNGTAATWTGVVNTVSGTNLLNTTFYVSYFNNNAGTYTIKLASTQAKGLAGTSDITFAAAPTQPVIMSPAVIHCKEQNAFLIEVYQLQSDNTDKLVESHVVSRNSNAKNGFGRNIFIEDYLAAKSLFIKAKNNVAIDAVTYPYPAAQVSTLRFAAGSNGAAVTEGNMMTAAQTLTNADNYKYKVFMDAGWATANFQITITNICAARQDSVAILSAPREVEESTTGTTSVINYRNNTLALDNSYAALYTPHLIVYDQDLDTELYVAPDGFAAAAISATYTNFKPWYPVAGYTRGVLNRLAVVRGVAVKYMDDGTGGSEVGLLYDAGINPIKFISGSGPVIWGQKTLSVRPSARDRLNVRLLLNEVEPVIKNTLKYYLMELHDPATQSVVDAVLRSYLDSIKASRGLYGYDVICNGTNNTPLDLANNTLNVAVLLQPVYAIEFIPVTIGIVKYGTDFKLIQSQL